MLLQWASAQMIVRALVEMGDHGWDVPGEGDDGDNDGPDEQGLVI